MEMILGNMHWVWLGLTVIFILIEIFTSGLTTIWFACGSFALIFISLLPIPIWGQLILFALISFLLLIFTRPILKNRLKIKPTATNADAIIGQKATVIKSIAPMQKGTIKINGMEWTAATESVEIAEGSLCLITEIRGATAIVKPLQP